MSLFQCQLTLGLYFLFNSERTTIKLCILPLAFYAIPLVNKVIIYIYAFTLQFPRDQGTIV